MASVKLMFCHAVWHIISPLIGPWLFYFFHDLLLWLWPNRYESVASEHHDLVFWLMDIKNGSYKLIYYNSSLHMSDRYLLLLRCVL